MPGYCFPNLAFLNSPCLPPLKPPQNWPRLQNASRALWCSQVANIALYLFPFGNVQGLFSCFLCPTLFRLCLQRNSTRLGQEVPSCLRSTPSVIGQLILVGVLAAKSHFSTFGPTSFSNSFVSSPKSEVRKFSHHSVHF